MANTITINAGASKAVRASLREFVGTHFPGKAIIEKDSGLDNVILEMSPPVIVRTGSDEAGWSKWDVTRRILDGYAVVACRRS